MRKSYSKYLPLIFLVIDLIFILGITFCLLNSEQLGSNFFIYILIFWIVSSIFTGFYTIKRFTGLLKLIRLTISQLILFVLGYFAYFGLFKEGIVINSQFKNIIVIIVTITTIKLLIFYLLKYYRKLGNNYRKIVFVGYDESSLKVIEVFKNQRDLGYCYLGFFNNEVNQNYDQDHLGGVHKLYNYAIEHTIDEIYVSLTSLKNSTIKKLMQFSNENDIVLKLLPNTNELYSKKHVSEFYNDSFHLLRVKKLPFEYVENRMIKRFFDVVFSLLVAFFIMTWLVPILWVFIRIESKGSLFFKQERDGVNGKKFICYKFRSMRKNKLADKIHATKNDVRITKVGKFIRKTSIDELPQFFNVLLGDMSVVGPRPHMNVHNEQFAKEIDNYIERHAVKPGITGLAQVSGFRGEIKQKSDIENRVRLDIFYIENWSFLFDIKIIIKTVINVFKGEEKAY